jgi:(p)ppGpp synthase/HD superfamily hydrolase
VKHEGIKEATLSTLERAIVIAAKAHTNKIDKGGAPYILHPLRVMLAMTDTDSRIVAVLHDVVEDHSPLWTLEKIRSEGFSEIVVEALDAVTQRKGEEYFTYIARAISNPIGRRVKIADTKDNMDLGRISDLTNKDFERLKKYKKVFKIIAEATPHGEEKA